MQFNPMNFVNNLYYMGMGMLGIFLVIGLIILVTLGLGKFSQSKSRQP